MSELPFRPLKQTAFGPDTGNCFETCVACLLGTDIPPKFLGDSWYGKFAQWTRDNTKFRALIHQIPDGSLGHLEGRYVIASGKSPRYSCLHSVIAKIENGSIAYVHDPHPDETFVVGECVDVIYFEPRPS